MIVPLRLFGIAVLAASSLGCGTQPSPPGRDRPASAPPPSPPSHRAPPAPEVETTTALVDRAFGGTAPAFPLLARSGNEVAVGIASPIGGSHVASYRVTTFSNWTNLTDAWGSSAVDLPLVDATMTTMLLDRAMGEPAPAPDRRLLAERAAAITQRLRTGGFSPFDAGVTPLDADDTVLGPVTLRATRGPDGELIVRLLDADDGELAAHTIAPQSTGLVAGTDCRATPLARRAWVDTQRRRLLVEVGWSSSEAACGLPDPEYGMWPLP